MKITISIAQVLRGVYADAALMSASMDGIRRPPLLRREHEKALKHTCLSVWASMMAGLAPYVGECEFTPTSILPAEEPEMLIVELTGREAEAHGGALRLQLETALERRLLAVAYRETWPDASGANEALADRAIAGFVALSRGKTRATAEIRPWGA
ncbi:MAG: hypothetical protein K2M06_03930 [Muribaculaceae bacterium]|nr:hypothetical protein [Muribaculaceae bacterium]